MRACGLNPPIRFDPRSSGRFRVANRRAAEAAELREDLRVEVRFLLGLYRWFGRLGGHDSPALVPASRSQFPAPYRVVLLDERGSECKTDSSFATVSR
jgi:hypothetical protein